MSKPNRLQRQAFRNQRASEAARARKAADPWEQARRRVRELKLPPSCALFVDAIAERHRELGLACRDQQVFVGYGDGTPAEMLARQRKPVQRPRHPGRLPPLTEVTGRSRRTMIRAAKLLEGHDVMNRRRAGELVDRPFACRTKAGVVRGVRVHAIGRGGCDAGGLGLANGYWPFGMEDPDPTVPPRPAPAPDGRPRTRYGDLVDHVRAQRGGRPERTRGP